MGWIFRDVTMYRTYEMKLSDEKEFKRQTPEECAQDRRGTVNKGKAFLHVENYSFFQLLSNYMEGHIRK